MSTPKDRMKEIRETFHLNQRQLALRIGVTSQLISQIEMGKIQVSNMIARVIEGEFGVNHDWLLYGEGCMVTDKQNATRHSALCDELTTALGYYPAIADELNRLAKKMTLADWEALNTFLSRQSEE